MRRATRTAIATHFWLILASIISIFPIVWVSFDFPEVQRGRLSDHADRSDSLAPEF